jgi:hypothetical protein
MKNLLLLFVLILSMMNARAQTCSAPIYMTVMNGNTYRFYTDTVPDIQSYAWYVTTFQADTATSSASFSATPSAYFAGSTFNSPDYVEACLTLTFSDGCTASSCDTFVYCDAGFSYSLDNQYGLTLTPDFPAGYMNELHYWTVSGPGIPNPTQNTEIATYYVTPGATYNVCQQLMITSSGCNTTECQVITIPDTTIPVCDAAFTYYYQPTNAYLNVSSPYTYGQGSFEHNWLVTSYMSDGTVNTNNQLNVNNNSLFVASNTSALEICHTLTNLNTGCVDSSCQYLDFCTAEYTHVIDTANQVLTLTAGGVQTLASHSWNVTYHATGGVYDSEILNGPIATFLLPEGILDMTICHVVNNTFPGSTCSTYTCDTIVFCNAEFTVIDNGNGTAGIWAVSPPIDGAVYTWSITGPGYPGTAYSGSYFNFTPAPNDPYYVCMAYFNAETGCSDVNCDTIVVEGIVDTCSVEFTLNYENFILTGTPTVPYTSGNIYSWTINSTTYGANSYSGQTLMYTLPADAGEVSVCLNIVNTFTGCNAVYCDSLQLPTIDCASFCAAEILPGPDSATAMLVNLFFNGVNTDFINYPYVTAITSITGDTLATGSMNYFGQIGGTQQLYPVYSVDGNALPNNFNGYVHFTYDNQTCVLPYPCVPTCNATFTWVDNGNGTITAIAAPYFSGNEYTWVLTEGSGGLTTTYDNFGNITLTLVPGEQYALCLTLSNVLSNCSNEYCTNVSVPVTATCNAVFTYTGPLPIDNSYQFIGAMNDTAAYNEWTFGDGTSSTLAMPFHSFATSGMYEVCHIVGISGVCSDTVCYTANFIGNNSTGLYITGEVNAGANVPDNGKVKLYAIDTLSNSVSLVDEYILNNSGNYIFNGLEAGTYLIKAGLAQGSAWYGDYVPTYFGSQFYWFDAEPVYLTQSGDNYDIALIYAGNGGGPGSVGGNIDDGPFRLMDPESAGVENSNPVAGADVIVTNLSGNPQRWMDADDYGNFNINNLAYGTYRLWADEPGMTCVPIEFTISPEFPSVFIELVMGEDLTGIEDNAAITALGEIYPNPASTNTFIKLNSNSTDDIIIQVSSLDGKVVHRVKQSVSGSSFIEIPSSGFAAGMYILQIRSAEKALSLTRKLQIVR